MEEKTKKLTKPRIMILSDENMMPLLQRNLAAYEPAFIRPRDSREAVERVRAADMAIITLHLQEGCFDVIRMVHEADEDLPVVILANSSQFVDIQVSMRAGATDFLNLPLDQETLVDVVSRAYFKRTGLRERFAIVQEMKALVEKMTAELAETRQGALDFCMNMLRLKAPSLETHSQHVGRIAEGFATYLGWAPDVVARIKLTGALHDFGYITLSDDVCRNGPRLPPEIFIWKKHPLIAKQLLRKLFGDTPLWDILERHHEKFDGSGFPERLIGKRIPLEARVLSLVNDFSNKVAPPSQQPAMAPEDAMLEIMNGSGTLYDPELVDKFVKFVSETKMNLA